LSADEICLTLPGDDAFHSVAHLVLGGLAVRLDLTFEYLEDLELALDAVLERSAPGEDVTVRVLIADDELRTVVGPLTSIRAELENGRGDGLSLGRILSAVCDGVAIEDRDGAQWVELTKRLDRAKGGVA
jgi:hypothetical protein